jgi:hypothetical protein
MMHQIHILTLSVRDHLSSHGMALGFSRLGYLVPGVSHIQNSFYSFHSNNKKHKGAQQTQDLGNQATLQFLYA